MALDRERWDALRAEAARVLETIERAELKDSEVPAISDVRRGAAWPATSPPTSAPSRAALIRAARRAQLLVLRRRSPSRRGRRAAEAVEPVIKSWERGETIVRSGDRVDDVALEAIDYFRLNEGGLDVARLVGLRRARRSS